MALPKEPRQKMINMMYLVLTALLALNVSAEIINAFKTVDNSLVKSNGVISEGNNNTYQSFAEKMNDPKTAEKAAIWKPRADKAKQLSDAVNGLIEKLKLDLKKESGYNPEGGDTTFKEDNLDASSRMFITNKEGDKLYAALDQYKKDILAIDPTIGKEFANKLPINLETPASSAGNSNLTWSQAYFNMTPTIAALTILSKFQNDVKNTESQVVTYCHNQIGAVKLIYDKFEPLVGTSSTYLMPGEEMEVKAGLGAFNAAVKPTVTIDGKSIPVNDNGVAETKFNAGGSGSRKMHVVVKYVDPSTGETKTLEKDVEYTVGAPSGVAVMPDKMNVLYVGVDNPLTITAGTGSEKTSASFSGGTISRASGNKWIAKPTSPGEHTVTVSADGKVAGKVGFRVKYLPPPVALVGTSEGGQLPSAQFKAMGGVRAILQNSEFDAQYEIISYSIAGMGPEFPDFIPVNNNGPRWQGGAATLVSRLKPGSGAYIDDIKAKGPDGRVIKLKPLTFILR